MLGNGQWHRACHGAWGYNVVLNDIDQMALDKSVEIIEKNMMRQLRGEIKKALQTALSRITRTTEIAQAGDSDVVMKPRLKMNRSSKRYLMPCCPI